MTRRSLVEGLGASAVLRAAEPPGQSLIFLSAADAVRIRAAVQAGERWTERPVRALRAEAEKWMRLGPWSVTYHRPPGAAAGPNRYYSEATYYWPDPADPARPYVRRDGELNPQRFQKNTESMQAMSGAVFTLGTTAWLFAEQRYAARAALLLRCWFLDAPTRMTPDLEHAQAIRNVNTGRAAGIIDSRPLIRCVQGARLLDEAGGLAAADRNGMRQWFAAYLNWLTTSRNGMKEGAERNNHGAWWAAQVAAFALFTGNMAAQQMAWDRFRSHLAAAIQPDGRAPLEEARTKSLSYSVFNAQAYATIARLAQASGVDLWSFRAPNGAGLETVISFLLPYAKKPGLWDKRQIAPFESDPDWLGFAGMGTRRPEYMHAYTELFRGRGSWAALLDLIVGQADGKILPGG